ncbi:hypothetical protein NY057_05135 [Curtobacterium flaccumfaciens]|uniref:hypothetical protein n=1 Tax=Curtobacterium flaccumfaciens TaxID=2035 RepID=UPI00220693C2|nr:hypothetical protein [Curtobacterium flaccumfaciens]UWD83630.1 hypothetical protein NY057_05135 [Curtobacterium flaccumfaciens]
MTAAEVIDILSGAQLTFVHEDELQAGLAAALGEAGVAARREVVLSDGRSRIDLLTDDRIGVEVKVAGSWANVVRQLTRYAKCPEVDELVLVTTRVAHHRIPAALEGKPVHLLSLIGAAL